MPAKKPKVSKKITAKSEPGFDAIFTLLSNIAAAVEIFGSDSNNHDKKLKTIAKELRNIKDDLLLEMHGLRVEMARVDEKISGVVKDLEISDRITRLEEKYEMLINSNFEEGFSLEPLEDPFEEFEDISDIDDDKDDSEDH